jgi:hypothetical protein
MVGGYIYVNVNVINANYNLELIFLFQISEQEKYKRRIYAYMVFLLHFSVYHISLACLVQIRTGSKEILRIDSPNSSQSEHGVF